MAFRRRACAPAHSLGRPHSHSTSGAPRRRGISLAVVLGVGTAIAVLPGATGSVASATPTQPPAATAKRAPVAATTSTAAAVARVRALQQQADLLVEQYDDATVALAAATRRSATLRRSVQTQQLRTDALRSALGKLVAAAYQSGDGGVGGVATTLLGGDDPGRVLDGAASLDAAAYNQQAQVGQYEQARQLLVAAQAEAAADLATRTRIQADLVRRRTAIERSLLAQQQVLSRLDAASRRSLTAPTGTSVPLSSILATGKAAAAIRFAYAQLGKPYRWGAAGPGSYDCSGLTMSAWAAAGVALPHSSRAQFAAFPHVTTGALQPGDLVFFGSPIHHVGIYIGGGNMIAAPHTGDVVKISPSLRGGFVGAVRPG